MFRRLFRLLVFAALLALALWAAARFLNREEDFEDYEDIDSTMDFTETPVEIEVPYEAGAATATQTEPPPSSGDSGPTADSQETVALAATEPGTPEEPTSSSTSGNSSGSGGSVIDVNGIGPTYAARLREIGINSLSDLAGADADDIAGKIDVIQGRTEIQDWIDQAKRMTSSAS